MARDSVNTRKPVIGLLGGVGAGKSTVAAEMARMGCARIDGDAIGHALLGDEQVRGEIRRRWGDGVFLPDGSVSRPALAAAVFGDRRQLEELNAILHPRIRRQIQREIQQAQDDPSIVAVVLDAAVMLEAGWDDMCTHLVFVSAAAEQRSQRVSSSRGWDEAAWASRESSQISLDRKADRCEYRLDNSSSVTHLSQQIRQLLERIATPRAVPD